MTGILSVISTNFGKSLVLASFFPTVVFSIVAVLLLAPFTPASTALLAPLQPLDPQWRVIVFGAMTFVVSGSLYYLNGPLTRLYEGYPWRHTWLGRFLTRRQRARYENLSARVTGLRTLLRVLSSIDDPRDDDINAEWNRINLALSTDFPGSHLLLPTHLGNVLRSFEYYPDQQYGMDAVTLWPRLLAKIDKDYAGAMADAKVALDFMLNSATLSSLLAVGLVLAGWLQSVVFVTSSQLIPWIAEILGFVLLAALFYNWAISCARDWGSMVKGSFDLYRSALLDQLGYKNAPATRFDERALWFKISQQMMYGDSPAATDPNETGPVVDYSYVGHAKPIGSARRGYAAPDLQTTRAVGQAAADGSLTITLHVRNASSYGAYDVVITDSLPDGMVYVWGSAILDQDAIAVTGANPYYFAAGDIPCSNEKTIRYQAVPSKKS